VAATAALTICPVLSAAEPTTSPFDAKGLPTRKLGKTGVRVPLIGLGNGSRFCAVKDEDKALDFEKKAVPVAAEKMDELRAALAPFYRHERLAWMRPSYRDGLLA
jgi:hypothetical protein